MVLEEQETQMGKARQPRDLQTAERHCIRDKTERQREEVVLWGSGAESIEEGVCATDGGTMERNIHWKYRGHCRNTPLKLREKEDYTLMVSFPTLQTPASASHLSNQARNHLEMKCGEMAKHFRMAGMMRAVALLLL